MNSVKKLTYKNTRPYQSSRIGTIAINALGAKLAENVHLDTLVDNSDDHRISCYANALKSIIWTTIGNRQLEGSPKIEIIGYGYHNVMNNYPNEKALIFSVKDFFSTAKTLEYLGQKTILNPKGRETLTPNQKQRN